MLRVARLFLVPGLLLAVFLLTSAGILSAQDADDGEPVPVPETAGETADSTEAKSDGIPVESSPYLLDMKLDDGDLNLIWDGYWRMTFQTGGSLGRLQAGRSFPGVSTSASFFQEPDVTLTLWIYDKWFIETTFLEGFSRNTYRTGYIGYPGEFVQEVVIGNAGVNAAGYAELEVPAPDYNTPGIAAKFATGKSNHELLVRYDPTDTEEKVFQGQFELNTQDIGLPDYIEGRYLILPDTDVSDVTVYLETPQGSLTGTDGQGVSRVYRQAEPVEFFVDNSRGLVVLNRPHDGQVAAFYQAEDSGSVIRDVGHPNLGSDFIITPDANLRPVVDPVAYSPFDFTQTDVYDTASPQRTFGVTSRVNIQGNDALILYDPARFSPFERQNVYLSDRPLPEQTWRIVPLIEDRGSLYPSTTTEYGFIPDTAEKTVSIYGATGSTEGLRDPVNRYPFAGSDPEVYGPGRETDRNKLSRIIVLAIRETNPGYFLGTGVVPDSVIVRVNGVRDKTVTVNDDGSLSFNNFIYIDDWIEVTFRTEVIDLAGGDLFVYQGNSFALGPNLNLELAESVRWNLSRNRSTSEFRESPGEIRVASTLDWRADNASVRLTADTSLTTPDTSGNLRLFGMDDGSYGLVFLEETVVAAPGKSGTPSPPAGNRTPADQYNYIESSFIGRAVLNDYLWPGATSTGEDSPALAARRSGDPVEGRVMEIRFDIPDDGGPNGEWTSGDFLADFSGPVDISDYTNISFPIQFRDDYGASTAWPLIEPVVRLQAGEIGESEDHHEDGSVNQPDGGLLVDWNLETDGEGTPISDAWALPGSWHQVSIPLSVVDAARLTSVRSFRIIIEDPADTTDISGRFIMGAPELTGSAFRTEVRAGSGDGDVLTDNQSVVSDETGAGAGDTLFADYPETARLFHSGGEDNRSLRIRWGNRVPGGTAISGDTPAAERWEAVSWFDGIPLESYRTLVFYVNNISGFGPMTAAATDSEGRGVSVTWDATAVGWDRIRVDIDGRTAESDGGQTISAVSVDGDAGEITRFTITFDDITSAPSGEMYVDEIHFSDPAFAVTGQTEVQAAWNYARDLAAVGDFPILGDISLDGRAQLIGGTVISGLDRDEYAVISSISAGADLLGLGVNTDWRTAWTGSELDWSGSHSLRIPARYEVFWFEDSFSYGESVDDVRFSRGNQINLRLGPGGLGLRATALYDGVYLNQGWGGDTDWRGEHWNAELDVRYILTSEESPEAGSGYFESWIQYYGYLLPSTEGITNREIHHEFISGLNFGPFALNWTPELRIKTARAPEWNQENRWAGTLSMPLTFGSWSLSTSYTRDLTQNVVPRSFDSFGDSWRVFLDSIGSTLPLIYYVPFREFFGTRDGEKFEAATEGMNTADYEVELAANLQRGAGSRLYDLVVPSSLDVSTNRLYQRKGDTVGWENEWRMSTTFSALNLFGRFGRYPVMGFYNSDEFSTLLQMTLNDFNGTSVPDPADLTIQTNWGFTGNRERRFVLDYRLTLNWDEDVRGTSHEGRLEYHWLTASREQLNLPLFNRVIPRQHRLENKERLTIAGSHPWSDAPAAAFGQISFLLYHETSWVFTDSGHLKGWLAIGLGETDDDFINGWELGVEAEFRF